MSSLPHNLYTAAQVRELDRIAIEEHGIPGGTLMERAGRAAFAALCRRWPRARSVGVLCGVGNNGGDGFVVARLAHEAGMAVSVYQVGDETRVRGDALRVREQMVAAGLMYQKFSGALDGDVLVDGLLGTGLDGAVTGEWAQAIDAINAAHDSGRGVLALDIPSGLHADTGRVLGAAVRADACATFIGLKQGLFTCKGRDYCGALLFDDLGVPAEIFQRVTPSATRLDWTSMNDVLAPRAPSAHKGDFGHVLVVGGERGMSGAARLAGEAALRAGAGLVSVATRAEHAAAMTAVRPELMCHGVETPGDLLPLLRRATVVAIGPGLGQGEWGRQMFGALLDVRVPRVLDADALNGLASEPLRRDDWILTPHPGEAARLLGCSTVDVENDRIACAQSLQQRYGGVAVLKGAGTVVASDSRVAICSEGNPGMASGGMGDVLTGVIAGLLAQGLTSAQAAQTGVSLHAHAADLAAQDGQRGLLASDLFPHIRRLLG
jgi:NAD(P)H-hydrate epimerase